MPVVVSISTVHIQEPTKEISRIICRATAQMIVAAPEKPGAFLNSDNPLMSPRHRVANRAGTGAGFLKTSSTLSVRRYARSTDWNASTGHVTRHVLHRCFNMPHISLRTQAAGATAVKANGYA